MNTYITYETAKALKSFCPELPEPMAGVKYCTGCEFLSDIKLPPNSIACCPDNSHTIPAYQLHDILGYRFCEVISIKVTDKIPGEVSEALWKAYWLGGLPAVEVELIKMMEGK